MTNIRNFIIEQKDYFVNNIKFIVWEDDQWDVSKWIPHRAGKSYFDFRTISSRLIPDSKSGLEIPSEYNLFIKAFAVYMRRSRRTGYMSIRNYIYELRRLYCLVLQPRNEDLPSLLTKWHFEQLLQTRKDEKYKNLYDSAANIKLIADTIDNLQLLDTRIDFEHGLKLQNQYNDRKKAKAKYSDDERNTEKIPSNEYFKAYAKCTNNPINDNEEILLRTIDLLIALGQRGNEVTVIPYDCLIEKYQYSDTGEIITDAHGNPIKVYGIKYYGEKNFEPKIHYLSDLDWPFAKRAIERLRILTEEVREMAKFQENNPGRIWGFNPDEILVDFEVMRLLNFKSYINLHSYLKRKGVRRHHYDIDNNRREKYGSRIYSYRNYYQAGDIEKILKKDLTDHFDFRISNGDKAKTVLKTSEILSIRFEGAFQFKERGAHLKKVFPHRTKLKEINDALGGAGMNQTMFERRGLTEKDGSKLRATSHSFRHWRNTIYQLTGMTDVQQALALGRNDISQNKYYQHETLKEKTESHRSFLNFNNNQEKASFLKKGIKDGSIKGSLTSLYNKIKRQQSAKDADEFLSIHANSLHITPFGGCTHDFSQSPCLKHLQCWNGCSHLHRTGSPEETERLEELLSNLKKQKEKQDKELPEGSVWAKDLNDKIQNLESALSSDVKGISNTPTKVFPGSQYMLIFGKDKTSSVSDE